MSLKFQIKSAKKIPTKIKVKKKSKKNAQIKVQKNGQKLQKKVKNKSPKKSPKKKGQKKSPKKVQKKIPTIYMSCAVISHKFAIILLKRHVATSLYETIICLAVAMLRSSAALSNPSLLSTSVICLVTPSLFASMWDVNG